MTLLAIFLALVCCYSLTSGCLEKSILTAPIGFTAAGMLVPLLLPGVGEWRGSLEALLRVAEIGLVLLLFTDASRTGLVYLEHASLESGKSTIQSEVMVTVLLSIFAHGLSAIPGINLYAATLSKTGAGALEAGGSASAKVLN